MKNWNEQIRPRSGDEIVGNSEFVEAFNEWAATDNYPSALLLVGPAGTGKSSAANAIIHTMLGKWNNDMNVMWTNASDDRGIDHIRKEVKQFSRLSGVGISRKIVVLDEADGLTGPSQDSLKGIMEKYASRVLFILTANHPEKIKAPLKSRCTTFIFNRVSSQEGAKHLMRLTEHCHAPAEWEQHYESIIEYTNGDLRAAVNLLEATPKNPNALNNYIIDTSEDDWWDDLYKDEYNSVRECLQKSLDSHGGRLAMMNQFHRTVKGQFDSSPDTAYSVIAVWGDMMDKVHEWAGSDTAFVDVLVARIKREIEVKNK